MAKPEISYSIIFKGLVQERPGNGSKRLHASFGSPESEGWAARLSEEQVRDYLAGDVQQDPATVIFSDDQLIRALGAFKACRGHNAANTSTPEPRR